MFSVFVQKRFLTFLGPLISVGPTSGQASFGSKSLEVFSAIVWLLLRKLMYENGALIIMLHVLMIISKLDGAHADEKGIQSRAEAHNTCARICGETLCPFPATVKAMLRQQ